MPGEGIAACSGRHCVAPSLVGWPIGSGLATACPQAPITIGLIDTAVNPDSVREFVAKVPHRVEQIWLPDVTQFDFYDQAGPMTTAVDAATTHFLRTLDAR